MNKTTKKNTNGNDILIKKMNLIIAENDQLNSKIKQVNNILYNIEEGLLQFDESLIVKEEISMKAIDLFQKDIRNCFFPDILYPLDKDKNNFLCKILPKILIEKKSSKRDIYLSLLSDKMTLNNISISLKYKVVTNNTSSNEMIVIISDLSNLENIEEQKQLEIEKLNKIISISNNYNDFMLIYNEYVNFFVQDIFIIIDEKNSTNDLKLLEIFRRVHTFKGNFSQFNLTKLSSELHDFETEIERNKENLSKQDSISLIKFISKNNFIGWLDSEMKEIKKILGNDYFKTSSKIIVSREKIYEIHDLIKERVTRYTAKEILPYVLEILKIPFYTMFQYYQDYLVSLASSQNKRINLPKITGGDFLVDVKKFNPFVKSLVHIFRNCISHGLEIPDDRELLNKNEFGNIDIFLGNNSDVIYIMIADDGRGIDEKILKKKLIEKKMFTEMQLSKMNKSKIFKQIFTNGFSTQDITTDLSGRGMGLSAVKVEVDNLGGTIDIESNLDRGTSFIFTFPNNSKSKKSKNKISTFDVMESTVDTLHDLISNVMNIEIKDHDSNFLITKTSNLLLNKVSAILNINGALKGAFILSINIEIAKKMTEVFMGTVDLNSVITSEDESIMETFESVTSEYANIVIGNSIKKFKNIENFVDISYPYTITSDNTTIKYPDSKVFESFIYTKLGYIKLFFITDSNIDNLII